MLRVSRSVIPDHIREGDALESWAFLGWRIDRILTLRHRNPKKSEFRYRVTPSQPVPGFRHPPHRLSSLSAAMAVILCTHGHATAKCAACYMPVTCTPRMLNAPVYATRTDQFVLQEWKRQDWGLWRAVPRCPHCRSRSLEALKIAVEAEALPIGGLLAVVKGGVPYLMHVSPDGQVRYERLDESVPGVSQQVSWWGRF